MLGISRALLVALLMLGLSAGSLAESAALSEAQVKDYLRTELELQYLLRDYKANADQYKDAPRTYALAEASYLQSKGYSVDEWHALEARVVNAANMLQEYDDIRQAQARRAEDDLRICQEAKEYAAQKHKLEEEQQQKAEEIAKQMRAAGLPEAQIKEMLSQIQGMPTLAEIRTEQCQSAKPATAQYMAEENRYIEITRPDWPAVRPYLDSFNQLVNWAAGNQLSPPALE
ncbi:hypothetical protein IMCC21906_00311 [Spongiibacter sp. IMCC21906]|uniref:hypothetical protein n=1 Tax=Spongiibacter sp. IMCC21906 TaxID=1620392 RepID=UPI00062DD59F|nr:hypothetical protein [Spongiibacter sp. IMCC21906]AKH68004.1 hypothetical protein IMCC21906_00311 [Spongiibacter sp. IMCC21906]